MSHVVTFQPSGHVVRCDAEISILDAGLTQGLGLPFSCRSGICRTCRGRVVAGSVDVGDVHPAYLTDADRAAGFVHLCQARPVSDCTIEIDELDPSASFPAQHLPARILAMTRLAPDVMALQIGTPSNEPVRFAAGQYMDIHLPDGARRSYSIAVPPAGGGVTRLEVHVRHMPGGRFTDDVFHRMRPRDLIRIAVPQGRSFPLDGSDKPLVLVCSGTGFAPVKAIVEHAFAEGTTRPMHLYWGGRRRADLYLDALAREWASTGRLTYTPVLSDATAACGWRGRTGFVHRAVLEDLPDLAAHQVYACGVPVMVEAARHDFTRSGRLPDHEFHADSFVSTQDRIAPPTPMTEAA